MERKLYLTGAAGLLAITLLMAPAVKASVITYVGGDVGATSGDPRPNSNNAAASFDAAVSDETIIDFESSPLGAFSSLALTPGASISSSTSASVLNVAEGTPDSLFGYNTTSGGSQYVSLFGGSLTFSFAAPIDAFGFYISGVQLDGETVSFNDGIPEQITIPNLGLSFGGVEFVGFTDFGAGISSVTINTPGDITGVDDLRFATGEAGGGGSGPPSVPEPSSLLLFGTIAGGIAVLRRRRILN